MKFVFALAQGYFGVMALLCMLSHEDGHALISLIGFIVAYGFDEVLAALRRHK